jgi:hypothetical protein
MNNLNTARAPNIKHNSPKVKDVCYFADRVRYMLDVKINHLRLAMYKSDNLPNIDMFMIRIQALEWVRGYYHHQVKNGGIKTLFVSHILTLICHLFI